MNVLISAGQLVLMRYELISELVKREMADRHTGQALGVIWAYGHTLFIMIVYTFLFAYVFPTRFTVGQSEADFSVNVLVGILSWLVFQDVLARSTSILIGHASLVKQIVFPTEILPIKTVFASVIPYSAAFLFTIGYASFKGTLTWFSLLTPIVIVFQIIAMMGVAFLFASVGVFFRDLRDLVTVFCTVSLFAQPILYNPNATPIWLHWIFMVNPFSYMVWCWQDVLYNGYIAHPLAWIVFPLGSILTFVLGWTIFERIKPSFGDAL